MNDLKSTDQIIHNLKSRGYKTYFMLRQNSIYDMVTDRHFGPEEFQVDECYEIPDNGSTKMIFAITSVDGLKGTMIEDSVFKKCS